MRATIHGHQIDLAANISLLFSEVPYLERPRAAADAGFRLIESWWPFAVAEPEGDDVSAFIDAVADSGTRLVGLNAWAGDMPGGERGVACRPERRDELVSSIPALLEIAAETGVTRFNLLYGQPDDGTPSDRWRGAGREAIELVAAAVRDVEGVVLIEALAGGLNGSYPLLSDRDVAEVIAEVDTGAVAMLFDTFHLGMNGVDLVEAARTPLAPIGHVQLADAPDRDAPGTGTLPIGEALGVLLDGGYDGAVALEFKPATSTADSLARLRLA